MDDLTLLKTISLASVLEKEVEKRILSGELPPGMRLNEIQLANQFGTSRGPLREATRSLEAKGLVEFVRNKGVFVRSLSVKEAVEIYDLRAALLGLAGRLLSQRMTDAILNDLNEQLRKMDEAAAKRSFEEYYPLNLAFHDFIVISAGSEMLATEYKRFVKKMHLFRAKSLVQGGGLSVSNLEHREMVDALSSGDPERAHASHWRHIDKAKQRLLAAEEAEKAGKAS